MIQMRRRPLSIAVVNPVRVTGSGGLLRHLEQVLPRWQRDERVRRVVVIVPRGAIAGLGRMGAEIVHVAARDFATGFREMGEIVDGGGFDVAISTSPRVVPTRHVPLATMVQNIEPIQPARYRMPMLWRARLWRLRQEIKAAVRQATRVIAVSKYVKEMVCDTCGVAPQTVEVVYHGFASEDVSETIPPAAPRAGRFGFCAGSLVPYRGFEDVVMALGRLDRGGMESVRFLFAGSGHHHARGYERDLRRLAERCGVTDQVIWLGELGREEMAWCYRHAEIFVQTSRAEACPNIVLEAMGHGCAIVSCDQPPMPELLGNAAHYYNTGDPGQLSMVLSQLMSAPEHVRRGLGERARAAAGRFSWDDTATRTLDVLARCVSVAN